MAHAGPRRVSRRRTAAQAPAPLPSAAAALRAAGGPSAAVPWNTVTGHVGAPLCWALTAPAPGTVSLDVLLPATTYAGLAYELTTTSTAANASTGAANFDGLVAIPHATPGFCSGG